MGKNNVSLKLIASVCLGVILLTFSGTVLFALWNKYQQKQLIKSLEISEYAIGLEAVEINYGNKIELYAKKHELNSDFLKALCMLECGGRKKIPSRFEPHVYKRLIRLQSSKLKHFENLRPRDLSGMSEGALRNMASSWGPFQIMGYKSIRLKCKIVDLRNENAIVKATEWIDKEYGKYIREERFKDAFHYHNTGRILSKLGRPATHDPKYIAKGVKFMNYFEILLS